ncbi:DNA ligase [Ideonella sp. 4Y11]|uniref:DNA ligase n=1 Tax=Ideonella aquatica TaxID=2824119 RepID=A0A941BQ89_9BURK|nr:DNA ligase [Ideonella aquatica]MBQ0958860.1 DNA ligase [Ideonella aquatica]
MDFDLSHGFWLGAAAQVAPEALQPHVTIVTQPIRVPAMLLARDAPAHPDPAGWLVSEKYDGVRALWDGQQLRSRSGRVIAAPPGFLARLPAHALDGELWLGRGRFEAMSALVHRVDATDADWAPVRFMVFELPAGRGGFAERVAQLQQLAPSDGVWQVVPQRSLPHAAALSSWLHEVVAGGGEGLMLHRADSPWHAGRSDALLKLKPQADDEAVVIGLVPGRGRLAGQVGALTVRDAQGRVFRIGTGLSDAQRRQPPPLGSRIGFHYRGRTANGLPRHASFWRLLGAGD